MKKIENREDIKLLVDQFYQKARKDELLGPVFNDIAKVDWDSHLPVMYDFWESTLLGNPVYQGNPMTPHIALSKKVALTKTHFDRWMDIFFATLDAHFEGQKAEETKQRVQSIAAIMQHKINQA